MQKLGVRQSRGSINAKVGSDELYATTPGQVRFDDAPFWLPFPSRPPAALWPCVYKICQPPRRPLTYVKVFPTSPPPAPAPTGVPAAASPAQATLVRVNDAKFKKM